ncbi:hypothetical protein CPB85DRAFT_1258142 [Mucidula mucida]|nr:hypothetical protein CPB85DRAFT_1258142 [Mucidula mucida]
MFGRQHFVLLVFSIAYAFSEGAALRADPVAVLLVPQAVEVEENWDVWKEDVVGQRGLRYDLESRSDTHDNPYSQSGHLLQIVTQLSIPAMEYLRKSFAAKRLLGHQVVVKLAATINTHTLQLLPRLSLRHDMIEFKRIQQLRLCLCPEVIWYPVHGMTVCGAHQI